MPTSPYVARLRQRVGHDLLQLVSVAVLPRDQQGRVLLVRHAFNGQWGLIGGAIELDEDPADAACREASEEIGVDIELGALLGVFSGPEYRVTYDNGDLVSYVVVTYEATVGTGEPIPDGVEVTEVAWHDPAELDAESLNPINRALWRAVGVVPKS